MQRKYILLITLLLSCLMPSWATQQITIASVAHGTAVVDKSTAVAGETVTISVTPNAGYTISVDDIVAEATIAPDNAHAPRHAQDINIGVFLPVTEVTAAQTYTFVMPDSPCDVVISANFSLANQTITIVDTEHGSISAPSTAKLGEEVTLTLHPDANYRVESVTVLTDNGVTILVTESDTNVYTFVMPESNVTVIATFTKDGPTAVDTIRTSDNDIHYYDLNGHYIGRSLNHAPHGVYITSMGKKVIK